MGGAHLPRLLAACSLAAAVSSGVLALTFSIENAALPGPAASSLVALRAAEWLARHRLTDSIIWIADRPAIGARCASAWFEGRGHRRDLGSLVRFSDGFTLLALAPHTLARGGGLAIDRSISPLVDLELAGCSRFLARRLEADAQRRGVLHLRRTITPGGTVLWALRLPIDHTTLTLDLTARSYRPVALSVSTPRIRGRSSFRFATLSTAALHSLLRNLHA